MFVVIYFTGGTGPQALIVYGPFTSQASAQAWINGQTSPALYSVAQVFSAPPYAQGQQAQVQQVTAGQFLVAVGASTITGGSSIYLYGPFTTMGAAQAYIAGRANPGGTQVCTVQAV